MRWILLALACSACAATPSADNFGTSFAPGIPKEVRLFVIDAQACTHFSGEGPTGDPGRDEFLARMMRKTCRDLDARKAQLLARHGGSEEIRAAVNEAWEG